MPASQAGRRRFESGRPLSATPSPAVASDPAGELVWSRRSPAVTFPSNKRPPESQPLQLVTEVLEVLLDPVLDHFRPVPYVAQVGVHPADHLLRAVAELAGDRVEAYRRASIKCLSVGTASGAGACSRSISACAARRRRRLLSYREHLLGRGGPSATARIVQVCLRFRGPERSMGWHPPRIRMSDLPLPNSGRSTARSLRSASIACAPP